MFSLHYGNYAGAFTRDFDVSFFSAIDGHTATAHILELCLKSANNTTYTTIHISLYVHIKLILLFYKYRMKY